jgi:hypothetical protein
MNGKNHWCVGWGAIQFMETVLTTHKSVHSFERIKDIQFLITYKRRRTPLNVGLVDLNVVLVDEYELGQAAAYKIIQEFNGVQVIVNNGDWNHIAFDPREFEKTTQVVVVQMKGFVRGLGGAVSKFFP